MPDSWLILSPVAAPACGVHKNCKITFTPDGGAINVAKRGNKSESLPLYVIFADFCHLRAVEFQRRARLKGGPQVV